MTTSALRNLWRWSVLIACGVVAAVAAIGCENVRREPVPLKAVILCDVHGMYGGRNLWLSSDGTGVVQVVGHLTPPDGLLEKRYRIRFDAAVVAEAERLVGEHRFLDLKLKPRAGVPDESRPSISVLTKAGGRATVAKWQNDKVPDFDPLYAHLLILAQKLDGAELIHEGVFDWDWHPDGFPSPKEIRGWSE